jgi:dimethylargininase
MAASTPCYHFNSAIVRTPSQSVVNGLRAEDRGDPVFEAVKAEHAAYVAALESAGLAVTLLPALDAYPDSVFVEDPALVFTEGAIVLRPGSPVRQGEAAEIAPALHDLFDMVLELPRPGHADGGDILVTPESVLIGLSARTDANGAAGLVECLNTLGYRGEIVHPPDGVLHFKTACALLDAETVLVTPPMARSGIFDRFRNILIPDGEEPAANALRINDAVLVSAHYPRTIDLLSRAGYAVVPLKTAEIEKIDAGLSCMSLRWFQREQL